MTLNSDYNSIPSFEQVHNLYFLFQNCDNTILVEKVSDSQYDIAAVAIGLKLSLLTTVWPNNFSVKTNAVRELMLWDLASKADKENMADEVRIKASDTNVSCALAHEYDLILNGFKLSESYGPSAAKAIRKLSLELQVSLQSVLDGG